MNYFNFYPVLYFEVKVVLIIEDTLLALSKVVEYIHQRPRQMNADVTLSLTIIEGNAEVLYIIILSSIIVITY